MGKLFGRDNGRPAVVGKVWLLRTRQERCEETRYTEQHKSEMCHAPHGPRILLCQHSLDEDPDHLYPLTRTLSRQGRGLGEREGKLGLLKGVT